MSTRSFQTFFIVFQGGKRYRKIFHHVLLSCLFLLPTHYNPPLPLSSKPNNLFHCGISTFSSSSWRTNKAFSFTASARSRLVDENNHTSTGCVIIIASLFYTNISLSTSPRSGTTTCLSSFFLSHPNWTLEVFPTPVIRGNTHAEEYSKQPPFYHINKPFYQTDVQFIHVITFIE